MGAVDAARVLSSLSKIGGDPKTVPSTRAVPPAPRISTPFLALEIEMKFAKLSVFGLVACLLFADFADAQLFRRGVQRTRTTTVQSCPGGVCSTAQVQTVRTIARPVQAVIIPAVVIPAPRPQATLSQPVSTDQTFGLGEYSVLEVREVVIPEHVLAQIADEPFEVARESFRSALLKTVAKQRKAGKISVRDAVKIRVALWSPAFVERAHELAVTQVAFNGEASDAVPVDDQGVVRAEGINWEGLAKFLEAILPLILSLLKAFGV